MENNLKLYSQVQPGEKFYIGLPGADVYVKQTNGWSNHDGAARLFPSDLLVTIVPPEPFNLIDSIIAFESGELDDDGVIELFQHLIDTGQAWTLQGSYGRTAHNLIKLGYCVPAGE